MDTLLIITLVCMWVLVGSVFPPTENKVWFCIWITPLVLVGFYFLGTTFAWVGFYFLGTTFAWVFGIYLLYRIIKLIMSNI